MKEMLPEYLKGTLSEGVRMDVEVHLKECCQECMAELSFISEFGKVEVSDPGDIFWETLPQRVRAAIEEEKAKSLTLRSLFFRQLPVAVTIAVLFLLVFTHTRKQETLALDPFFNDPFTSGVSDYSDITEKDMPLITERLTADGFNIYADNFMASSYYREFASLSSRELGSLYEALKEEQKTGG